MYNFTPAPKGCDFSRKEIKALKMIFSARMWEPPSTPGKAKIPRWLNAPLPTAIRPLLIALPHYCPTFMTLLHPLTPPSLSPCFPYFPTLPSSPYRGVIGTHGNPGSCSVCRKRPLFSAAPLCGSVPILAEFAEFKFPPPRHSGRMALAYQYQIANSVFPFLLLR